MRPLLAKDLAPFTKVVAKMGMRDSIKKMLTESKEGKGGKVADFIWAIIENYHKAEAEFFAFLASVEGKTADEIAELPMADFISLVTELFSGDNLPFFKSLAK